MGREVPGGAGCPGGPGAPRSRLVSSRYPRPAQSAAPPPEPTGSTHRRHRDPQRHRSATAAPGEVSFFRRATKFSPRNVTAAAPPAAPGQSTPRGGGAGGHGVAPDTSSGAALAAPRAGRRLRIGPGAPGRAVSGAERSLFCRSRSTQTTKPTPLIPSRSPLNKHPPPSPADPNPIACALSPTLSAAPVIPGTAVPAALGSLLRGHGCAPATLRAELRGAVGAGCAHLSCGHGRTDGRTAFPQRWETLSARRCCLHRDITAISPRCHRALRPMGAAPSAGAEQPAAERLSLSFPWAVLGCTKNLQVHFSFPHVSFLQSKIEMC